MNTEQPGDGTPEKNDDDNSKDAAANENDTAKPENNLPTFTDPKAGEPVETDWDPPKDETASATVQCRNSLMDEANVHILMRALKNNQRTHTLRFDAAGLEADLIAKLATGLISAGDKLCLRTLQLENNPVGSTCDFDPVCGDEGDAARLKALAEASAASANAAEADKADGSKSPPKAKSKPVGSQQEAEADWNALMTSIDEMERNRMVQDRKRIVRKWRSALGARPLQRLVRDPHIIRLFELTKDAAVVRASERFADGCLQNSGCASAGGGDQENTRPASNEQATKSASSASSAFDEDGDGSPSEKVDTRQHTSGDGAVHRPDFADRRQNRLQLNNPFPQSANPHGSSDTKILPPPTPQQREKLDKRLEMAEWIEAMQDWLAENCGCDDDDETEDLTDEDENNDGDETKPIGANFTSRILPSPLEQQDNLNYEHNRRKKLLPPVQAFEQLFGDVLNNVAMGGAGDDRASVYDGVRCMLHFCAGDEDSVDADKVGDEESGDEKGENGENAVGDKKRTRSPSEGEQALLDEPTTSGFALANIFKSNVENISLRGCLLAASEANAIARTLADNLQAGVGKHLLSVNLAQNMLGDAGVKLLAPALKELRALKHLSLRENCLTATGLRALLCAYACEEVDADAVKNLQADAKAKEALAKKPPPP